MNKILLLASAMCFVTASASAFEFNPYISAKAKYTIARNEIKATGVNEGKVKIDDEIGGGSVAAGVIYPVATGKFRLEVEYTRNTDAKKAIENVETKVKTQAALFNVYFDLDMPNNIPVTPYAGVGLGWGQSKFVIGTRNEKENGAAMQIGAGLGYRIGNRAVLDLGYRYITYGDFDKEYRIPGIMYEKFEYKPHAHEISLGLRYEF